MIGPNGNGTRYQVLVLVTVLVLVPALLLVPILADNGTDTHRYYILPTSNRRDLRVLIMVMAIMASVGPNLVPGTGSGRPYRHNYWYWYCWYWYTNIMITSTGTR